MTNPTPHGQVPEALRLAHIFDNPLPPEWPDMVAAAAELRRQHARIAELESELEAVGAGGVSGPLIGRAALSANAGEPVAWQYRSLRDNGAWFDCTKERFEMRCTQPEIWETRALYAAPPTSQAEVENLRKALQFYADKEHFAIAEEGAWDTVSGEPQNYWCDEAGTAMVEDGSIAKMALAGQLINFADDEDETAPPTSAEGVEHG